MAIGSTIHNWIARFLVLIVFAVNMYCAITFIFLPSTYVESYQLAGQGALAAIAGMGVAFVMWNVTYVPVIILPDRFRVIFIVVIVQQIVGLAGESWIYSGLGPQQAILAASIMRFIIFDSFGLILLLIAFLLSRN